MQTLVAQPVAMQALIGGVAALVGILAGILIRGAFAKSEKQSLIHRNEELANALTQAGNGLSESMAVAAKRAGFESLAEEREKRIAELAQERDTLRADLKAKTGAEAEARTRIGQLETELKRELENLPDKLMLLKNAEETLSNKFQTLAGDILEQKSKTFSEASQKELQPLLAPLREQINDFRKKVEEAQSDSKTGVTKLETLIGSLSSLNQALTAEAHNLATALRRDTKAQGNWGETILRNILDKSGLKEGLHYSFQQSFNEMNADGEPAQRRQTDVVVKLPGGRHLVIDSKVSLNAYNDSVNAENEKDRAEALKRHLVSMRSHFTELAGRNYHALDGIESPDFVVMFVPIEPAFLLALQNDDALWHDAYAKGVLLSGPTTVLFVVRIVEDLWRQEMQAQNVREVMDRGAKLYEKFAGFVDDMELIGKSLRNAGESYEDARRKLSEGPGNLIKQVQMLQELGVKPRKQIPARLLNAAGAGIENEAADEAVEVETEEPTLALAAEAEVQSSEG